MITYVMKFAPVEFWELQSFTCAMFQILLVTYAKFFTVLIGISSLWIFLIVGYLFLSLKVLLKELAR
jgi:hypothetical protein